MGDPILDTVVRLLDASAANADFRRDVATYAAGRTAERIVVVRHAPRVKVLRVLAQLLAHEPALGVCAVHVDAWSGCADFRGVLTVTCGAETRRWRFAWDCRWRAEVERWVDEWGIPDQVRAAHEFGWRCFAEWSELARDAVDASPVEERV